MSRVGVFGHSFGGAAALQFCQDDSRCKAGVDVDGAPHGSVIRSGVNRPFMILWSDHSGEHDPQGAQVMADLRSIYDHLPPDGRPFLEIRGANHFLFSDDGALLKGPIVMRALRLLGVVGIDGRRQLAVTAYCLRGFFDAELKGAPRFGVASSIYPEIQVVQRRREPPFVAAFTVNDSIAPPGHPPFSAGQPTACAVGCILPPLCG
jgi:pimeloyl-ACP methyl ester carboxylesterase